MKVLYKQEVKDIYGIYLKILVYVNIDWIYNDWIGYIEEKRVKEGILKYLDVMKSYGLYKILSDNRNQHGPYPEGTKEWVIDRWLNSTKEYGFLGGATILSKKLFARLSVDESIKDVNGVIYGNFEDEVQTKNWLLNLK